MSAHIFMICRSRPAVKIPLGHRPLEPLLMSPSRPFFKWAKFMTNWCSYRTESRIVTFESSKPERGREVKETCRFRRCRWAPIAGAQGAPWSWHEFLIGVVICYLTGDWHWIWYVQAAGCMMLDFFLTRRSCCTKGSTVPYVVERIFGQGPALNMGRVFIPTGSFRHLLYDISSIKQHKLR